MRTFQRWAERFEAEGDDGLVDRRMGRRSPRRAPEEELERMLGFYRNKYADFTVKHFHEQLQKRHGYVLGYTVTKLALHAAGRVRKAPKRSAHRKKCPRRPLRGMLLHQDGLRHRWIEGLPAMDLIVTMDDATSEVYSMLLVEEEGSVFQGYGAASPYSRANRGRERRFGQTVVLVRSAPSPIRQCSRKGARKAKITSSA